MNSGQIIEVIQLTLNSVSWFRVPLKIDQPQPCSTRVRYLLYHGYFGPAAPPAINAISRPIGVGKDVTACQMLQPGYKISHAA